jgi:hypothetical protein
MQTQPPSQKRLTKAAAGIIGSSNHFEWMLRESGALDSLSPQEVIQLQHTLEQYAVAMAAGGGLRLKCEIRRCLALRIAAVPQRTKNCIFQFDLFTLTHLV